MVGEIELNGSGSIWDAAARQNEVRGPFYDYRWHKAWFDILSDGWEPLLLASQGVMVPLAKKADLVMFSGGKEVTDYHDVIGPKRLKQQAWTEILSFLVNSNRGVGRLKLDSIPGDSETFGYFKNRVAEAVSGRRMTITLEEEDTTPKMLLPKSWEEYIETLGKKDRHELKRKVKKFKQENPSSRIFIRGAQDIEVALETLIELMRKDPRKMAFMTPAIRNFFERIVTDFRNETTLASLLVGDVPVASSLSFERDGVGYLYNAGFDVGKYPGAGFYLNAMNIKAAIEKGQKEYNFLRGNERYKYDLGAHDFPVYSVTIVLGEEN